MKETILIIDDEKNIRLSLAGILEDEGFVTRGAASGEEGLDAVRKEPPELVLLDIWMPGIDGMETLKRLKESHPFLPVVMMSGHGTIETAVKATKMGAYDFIEKPLSLEKILVTVTNALAMSRLREENRSLRTLSAKDHVMVGDSGIMKSFSEQLLLIAASDTPVLIAGESGTGKELAARLIHLNSPRRAHPFVELNCASVPDELVESELFGHEKGAFPGATARKKGRLELAEGGTLFLDRIESLPLRTQAKLLQFLGERTVQRVGGVHHHDVALRVVAAAIRPLEDEISQGRFLDELFSALNVLSLAVPPLRERPEDIGPLAEHFVGLYSHREGKERKQLAPEVTQRLIGYQWPGNVRELKNIVERLVIMTPGGVIGPEQLPLFLRGETVEVPPESDVPLPLKEARERFEREYISRTLEGCDWEVSRAAALLEVERSALFRRIKGYGIEVASQEGP
jgi:two-component system, NtrC family, nitrogen regulation response regulator NtrX